MDLTAVPEELHCQSVFFPKGSYILSDLEENNYFFILTEGVADVMYYGPDGESMRICRYFPVDFFGEIEMLTEHRQPMPIIAVQDCRVLRLSHSEVLQWLERDFDFCRHILSRMCEKLLCGMTGRTQMRYLTQRQRYLLAMESHARTGELSLLTKESLCQELSIPLRSLNRIIAQCADRFRYKKGVFEKVK